MKIEDVVNFQSCSIEKLRRQHGLREFCVFDQNTEHSDEKQQFSVHLEFKCPNYCSTKMACYVLLKCVLNHPITKYNHGGEKKVGVLGLFWRYDVL